MSKTNTGSFIENSFSISAKDILHNRRLVVDDGNTHHEVNYWIEETAHASTVHISTKGGEPQTFDMELEELTFGKRGYFKCSCGLRVNRLFLPHNGTEFGCRKCHGLQYQLSSFNRYSVAGKSLYRINRLHKLSNSRAGMTRIFYGGSYTKKFERFLRLCDRAGLDHIVKGAEDLRTLLNG